MANPAHELVDLIDDQGSTLGVVTRAEMRARRLPHRCTYILVFDCQGRLFVHLRTATKDVYPSHWDATIGGVMLAGESYDQGARREILEELGVVAEPQTLFPFRYEDTVTIVQGMVYHLLQPGPFQLQADEIVRGEFLSRPHLQQRIEQEPFCPDGLQVLAEYERRFPAGL
jgi:isopentenyldiphosphate isomerase